MEALEKKTLKFHLMGDAEFRMVWVDRELITPEASQQLINHSPDGFAWGYYGSAPGQLALAVLLHLTDSRIALGNYNNFKRDVIARLAIDKDFEMEVEYTVRQKPEWKNRKDLPNKHPIVQRGKGRRKSKGAE